MIKKQLYPKTKRVSEESGNIHITEKLDGSNLCIFKKDGEIYFAQRNNICTTEEVDYKGLKLWAKENYDFLKENLREGAVLCGEWIGMGKLKYDFQNRFFMFAKANITDNFELINIYYNQDLFIYPFACEQIPEFISVVPMVAYSFTYPTIDDLDGLYDVYTKEQNRNVEGFVINQDNVIKKYVRMKNGQVEPHKY